MSTDKNNTQDQRPAEKASLEEAVEMEEVLDLVESAPADDAKDQSTEKFDSTTASVQTDEDIIDLSELVAAPADTGEEAD